MKMATEVAQAEAFVLNYFGEPFSVTGVTCPRHHVRIVSSLAQSIPCLWLSC